MFLRMWEISGSSPNGKKNVTYQKKKKKNIVEDEAFSY